ncbi:MAG TPA: hypothetical protein VGD98_19690 [Ktedonobacteraceae bacterium]
MRHMSLDQFFSSKKTFKKTANFRADGSVAVARQVPDQSGQDPINRPSLALRTCSCVAGERSGRSPATQEQVRGARGVQKKRSPTVSN